MEKEEQLQISDKLEYFSKNPVEFIQFLWQDIYLWDKLEQIANSVRDYRGTVVPSGHGIGKSFIAARVAIWWLFTHYPSKVLTTAPTWAQVESVLWGEIRSAIQISQVKLTDEKDVLNTEIKLAPDWFAKGISTTESVSQREFGSTKFQGYHSPNLLVIFDEAPGVERSIHIAVETLATGQNNRILKIGNPTSPTGEFYNNCYSENWNKIQVSCFDHPNIKNQREIIPGAVTIDWIERQKKEWGEGSPLWLAKVLGEFPDETEDTLIPLSWCENATKWEVEQNDRCNLGVDPARFGDDKTVGYEIASNTAKLLFDISKEDTMMVSGRLVNIIDNYKSIGIDETGVGGGVVDRVREVLNSDLDPKGRKGYKVRGLHFGSQAINPIRFFNLRAEMYWNLRERLNPDNEQWNRLKIPYDSELINQLAGMKYSFTSNGRIQIESKDEVKKRIGKSPDRADALVIATWLDRPVQPELIAKNSIYKEFFDYRRGQNKTGFSKLKNL